jgi:membrane associated rhomboid family serine protease
MLPLRDNIPHRRRPVATIALVVLNVVIFFYELSLGKGLDPFINRFGAIPARVVHETSLASLFTLFSSIFLHGGFDHIIGNMLYLWIFGDNIEDAFGPLRFLGVYLVCGLVGSGLHILSAPGSTVPMIGASGAISGVLGAYLILYPKARVLALVPFIFFFRLVALPASLFLGVWILLQFLYLGTGSAGVAWLAHIGGFATGVGFGLWAKRRRRRWEWEVS